MGYDGVLDLLPGQRGLTQGRLDEARLTLAAINRAVGAEEPYHPRTFSLVPQDVLMCEHPAFLSSMPDRQLGLHASVDDKII